jgi:hypothetical protein
VFCEFNGYMGYTFFPKAALDPTNPKLYGVFDVDNVQTDTSRVLIRFLVSYHLEEES